MNKNWVIELMHDKPSAMNILNVVDWVCIMCVRFDERVLCVWLSMYNTYDAILVL